MPTAIAPASEIAAKWAEVTPGRTAHFEAGVRSPRRDWKNETLAAEDRYKAGVTKAAQEGRFGKGVTRAGTDKWQRKTIEIGVGRFGPGVAAAGPEFLAAWEPYRAVIAGVSPPQRYPTGDDRNLARVAAYSKPLHEKKVRG
ncbi:hypothetical protein ES708_21156 [subsurface metagenome]